MYIQEKASGCCLLITYFSFFVPGFLPNLIYVGSCSPQWSKLHSEGLFINNKALDRLLGWI